MRLEKEGECGVTRADDLTIRGILNDAIIALFQIERGYGS